MMTLITYRRRLRRVGSVTLWLGIKAGEGAGRGERSGTRRGGSIPLEGDAGDSATGITPNIRSLTPTARRGWIQPPVKRILNADGIETRRRQRSSSYYIASQPWPMRAGATRAVRRSFYV